MRGAAAGAVVQQDTTRERPFAGIDCDFVAVLIVIGCSVVEIIHTDPGSGIAVPVGQLTFDNFDDVQMISTLQNTGRDPQCFSRIW